MNVHYRVTIGQQRFTRTGTLDVLPPIGNPNYTLSLRIKKDEPGDGFRVTAIEHAPDSNEAWIEVEYSGKFSAEVKRAMLKEDSMWLPRETVR